MKRVYHDGCFGLQQARDEYERKLYDDIVDIKRAEELRQRGEEEEKPNVKIGVK